MKNAIRRLRPVLLVAGLGAAVVSLRGHLPDPSATWTVVRQASPLWLAVAVGLQVLSMTAFAEQQRQLLAGFGVRMTTRVSLAVSYARSAIATALPGGSAVSAGYAFRQYRTHGATQPIAAAVMVLSGVASVVGLILLYGGDALVWATSAHPVLLLSAAVLLAAGVVVLLRRRSPAGTAEPRPPLAEGASYPRRVRHTISETTRLAGTVPARRWAGVVGSAAVNWLTDLACLLAAIQAIGLDVSPRTVATAYLVAQLVRQIPVTPGGIGVIEAGLILALTTAGAPAAPAAAAVLIYRLLSCWSILPIGLACWTAQRRTADFSSIS
jgi:uncharacterized membrane protein YbhN (UPF0104 family)